MKITWRDVAHELHMNRRDERMTARLAFLWLARQPCGLAEMRAATKQQRDRLLNLADLRARTDVAPWVRYDPKTGMFEVTAAGWTALNLAEGRAQLAAEGL